MSKTTFFFDQSVFGQMISLIEPRIISDASKACDADRSFIPGFYLIEVFDKDQVGDLLHNRDSGSNAAIPEGVPDLIDFVFQFACYLATNIVYSNNG